MNRNDFQQLAEDHLRHAKALLDAELYSGAYYICGYEVECADGMNSATLCAKNVTGAKMRQAPLFKSLV